MDEPDTKQEQRDISASKIEEEVQFEDIVEKPLYDIEEDEDEDADEKLVHPDALADYDDSLEEATSIGD